MKLRNRHPYLWPAALVMVFVFYAPARSEPLLAIDSFAQEYEELGNLLSQVKDRASALYYRDRIAAEIEYLHTRQQAGETAYRQLSPAEQQNFILRFQQNQFHCSVITRVHSDARRLLLNPGAAEVLHDLITHIP